MWLISGIFLHQVRSWFPFNECFLIFDSTFPLKDQKFTLAFTIWFYFCLSFQKFQVSCLLCFLTCGQCHYFQHQMVPQTQVCYKFKLVCCSTWTWGWGGGLPKKGAYKPRPGTWVGPDVLSSYCGQTSWDSASQAPKQHLTLLTPCHDSPCCVSQGWERDMQGRSKATTTRWVTSRAHNSPMPVQQKGKTKCHTMACLLSQSIHSLRPLQAARGAVDQNTSFPTKMIGLHLMPGQFQKLYAWVLAREWGLLSSAWCWVSMQQAQHSKAKSCAYFSVLNPSG